MTKSQQVKELLQDNLGYTNREIADAIGCDVSLVYQQRKAMQASSKRGRGRPRKVATIQPTPIDIKDASKALLGLVSSIKDLSLSFDHDVDSVTVLWNEEMYRVGINELPQTIESIKYLKSKEPVYHSEDYYYEAV